MPIDVSVSSGKRTTLVDETLYKPEYMDLEASGLFRPLKAKHPDYDRDLQDLTKELNKVFTDWALKKGLKEKAKKWTNDRTGHVAAVGTPYGLHIAFCRRIEDPVVRDAVRIWIEARTPLR